MTDKQKLVQMLERAGEEYFVAERCGNSVCVKDVEFHFDGQDMLKCVVTVSELEGLC